MEFRLLGSLVDRKIGYGIVQPGPSIDGGVPVIKVNNLITGLTAVEDLDTTSAETAAKYSRTRLNGGELIVSVVGTIGRTAIVPAPFAGCNLVRATALVDIPEQWLSYWVKYYIDSPAGQAYIDQNLNTTVQPTLNIKSLIEMPIPFYEESFMKKTVAFLSTIDDKIANNNRINDNLQQQAQALFEQRFVWGDLEGEEKPLYDFADYINGAAFKPSECGDQGLPIIKIVELKNGITDSTRYFDGFKGEKYLIYDKDILFSWSGNPDTSIDIFIWTHGDAILNQHTFNVKSNTGHRWFTYLLLKYFKPEFSRIARNKQTTGLGHVTASDLKRLTFVYNIAAIEAFEAEICPIMDMVYTNMMENLSLAQLRDSLLPKLMSGELDVSDIQF